MKKNTLTCSTPVGILQLNGTSEFVKQVSFHSPHGPTGNPAPVKSVSKKGESAWFDVAEHALHSYFKGNFEFQPPEICLEGTNFQKSVWEEIKKIDPGKTCSYGDLSDLIGKSGAARAVGQACSQNPIPLFVPCHRVIRSDGTEGSYSGPPGTKSYLLDHERSNY